VTLNNVNPSDVVNLGFRAIDLANLRDKRLNIPLTFVINSQAFEEFLDENGLRQKIDSLLKDRKPAEAYLEILELFNNARFSRELESELSDAYESLTIDPGADASSIVSKWDYPFATLYRSPGYLLSTEDDEGIIQNVRGKENILAAVKHVWASIYSPRSVGYRNKTGIKPPFGLGVIVQKMRKIKHSVITYSRSDIDEKTIVVKSFFGLPDYGFEDVPGKDYYEVDLNSLSLTKGEVNVQEYSIERDFDTEELAKKQLGEEGTKQKINERLVSELARITKRAKSFIGKDLKMYFGVKDDYVFIFLANRLVGGPKKIIEAEEEVEVKFEPGQGTTVVQKQEMFIAKKEPLETFKMPPILSVDDVKAQLLKEKQSEGWDGEAGEVEEPPRVEVYEEKTKQEERVEKEINLLEEVLQIKEIIEKMEEHALNNNKEEYEREARILHQLISRVREEE
jgi:phosphoenolpyruvate synthase/pyruvate phosphate dikinase